MATRGWENATLNDVRDRRTSPKPSKYRNVKVVIDGERFDSKREATYWRGLKAREKNGEIDDLRRQVPFTLCAPERIEGRFHGAIATVATYIADFVYFENGQRHVVDAKGKRTAMYQLKKKWLAIQDGIQVEEA